PSFNLIRERAEPAGCSLPVPAAAIPADTSCGMLKASAPRMEGFFRKFLRAVRCSWCISCDYDLCLGGSKIAHLDLFSKDGFGPGKKFSVSGWGHLFDPQKLFVKIGQGIESALIANLQDRQIRINKQFAGMPDPYLVQKIEIGLLGAFFEITAEGGRAHAGKFGNLLQADRVGKA